MAGKYVQFGSGWHAPESWENYDVSLYMRLRELPLFGPLFARLARFPAHVRYGNIVTGLPVALGSCDGVYSCHVLEHLCLDDFRTALRNVHALLRPDGIYRFTVPDLQHHIGKYRRETDAGDWQAAPRFLNETLLGRAHRNTLRDTLIEIFTGSGGTYHKWMWDEASLRHEMAAAGFRDVRRCAFLDSQDPMMVIVERESQPEDVRQSKFHESITLEARR
ncbi:MAG: methyltransferase domain-containing protein [Rhodospirillales bacterium]|nr:methyltransferase domain-containing protein [Rhodospirillales bacterium]